MLAVSNFHSNFQVGMPILHSSSNKLRLVVGVARGRGLVEAGLKVRCSLRRKMRRERNRVSQRRVKSWKMDPMPHCPGKRLLEV